MSKLVAWWDKLPQNFRDAVGRFVKVIAAAATAAVVVYVVGVFKGNVPLNASDLWTAVAVAVISAVEKLFNIAPKVARTAK